jgi:polyphosphate kinase 2 (PPK2 family)
VGEEHEFLFLGGTIGRNMLEHILLDKKISKPDYQRVFPDMEIRMGALQRAAHLAEVPIMLSFEGWETAGKGRLINRLTQSLDPRGYQVHAISAPNEVERRFPWGWFPKTSGARHTTKSLSSKGSLPTTEW